MRSSKLFVVAALAIFAVAACGGSSASPTSPAATTAAAAGGTTPPASTQTPVTAATPAATAAPAGATAAPAGGSTDVCALLSAADLKTVTGNNFGAGALDSVGQCTWNVGGTGANTGDEVIAAFQDQTLSFMKSTFGGGVDVTVSGHAGYWNPANGLQSMWVDIGGGRLLVLSFPSSRTLGPDDQTIAQKLAEIAVGKI